MKITSKPKQRETKVHLSEESHASLQKLQTDLGCGSQSEMIDYLVLIQTHSEREARAILAKRSKRGNPRRKVVDQ